MDQDTVAVYQQTSRFLSGRLGRLHFMASLGWVVLLITILCLIQHFFYPIDFGRIPLVSFKRVVFLYEKRYWFLGIAILLAFFITWQIIRRCHDLNIPTIMTLIPVSIFYAGFLGMLWQLRFFLQKMAMPQGNLALIYRLIRNFDKELLSRATDIHQLIQSLKLPSYLMVYSYLVIFSFCILLKGRQTDNRYGAVVTKPVRKDQIVMALFFLGVFIYSVYYLVGHFIMHSPFAYFDQLLFLKQTLF